MIVEITEENFTDEVANSPVPCLLGFTAGWCTLCDEILPVLETVAARLDDDVKVCVINIDEQKQLRIRFAVAAVPYTVLVHKGMRTPLFDEMVTEERLEERVRYVLGGGEAPTTGPL